MFVIEAGVDLTSLASMSQQQQQEVLAAAAAMDPSTPRVSGYDAASIAPPVSASGASSGNSIYYSLLFIFVHFYRIFYQILRSLEPTPAEIRPQEAERVDNASSTTPAAATTTSPTNRSAGYG